MRDNTIYIVRDINKVLSKFCLTEQDKLFIIKNDWNPNMHTLKFFILEQNRKLSLFVKEDTEYEIYKLESDEIPNFYIRNFLLSNSIKKTNYKISKIEDEIVFENNGDSIPVDKLPKQAIFEHINKRGRFSATIYIKNATNSFLQITSYGDDAISTRNKMRNIINNRYILYLENESEWFNTRRTYVHTDIPKNIKKLTNHANLDTITENYNKISNLSDELDIDMET